MSDAPRPLALVTGASSGIGAQIARSLARRGFDCVLTARREARLEALATDLRAEHGVTAHVVPADLGDPAGASTLIDAVAALGVEVDVLVNNAGFGTYDPAWETDLARTRMMLELNMTALTTLTQHYVVQMVARGQGRVLQVASVGAFQPAPLYSAYAATKAYVLYYSEALAWELRSAGSKVTVTTLCPGLTESEFHATAVHTLPRWLERTKMSAESVAEIGVRSALRGKPVVVPCFVNLLSAWIIKVLPRSWATAGAGRLMSQ